MCPYKIVLFKCLLWPIVLKHCSPSGDVSTALMFGKEFKDLDQMMVEQ